MEKHLKLLSVLQLCFIIVSKSTANSVCTHIQGEDPPDKNKRIGFSSSHLLITEINVKWTRQIKELRETNATIFAENEYLRNFEVVTNDFEIFSQAKHILQNSSNLNPIENFTSKKFRENYNPLVKGAIFFILLLTMKFDTNYKTKLKRNFFSWILYFLLFRSVMGQTDCKNLNKVYTVDDTGTLPAIQLHALDNQSGSTDLSDIFELSGNNTLCYETFTYTMTVTTKPALALDTNFLSIDSGNQELNYEATDDVMYNGVYQILVTCCQINSMGVNYCGTTNITLNVGNCILSTDTITFDTLTILSQYYTLSDPISSVRTTPRMNADFCRNPDIVVTMTVTKPAGAPDYDFIIYNLTDRKVYYGIVTNPSYIGIYFISILVSITNAAGTVTETKTFTIEVNTCLLSTDAFTVSPNSPTSDFSYIMSSSSTVSVTVNQFSVGTSNFCYQTDIVYTMSITQKPAGASDISWITFDPATRKVTWGPKIELGYDGIYVITITGTVQTATIHTGIDPFNLEVSPTCLLSTNSITISGTSPGAKTYQLGGASASTTVTAFTENSNYCTPSDIVYSMSVTSVPSGVIDTSWITFNSATRVVTWVKAPAVGFIGDYTITIYGTISNSNAVVGGAVQTGSISFVLTVTPTCATSIDIITITNGGSPGAKTYQLGAASASTTVNAFTENSPIYCTQSNIVYSMSVTSVPSGVTDVSWITFNSATRVVTWVKAPVIGFIGDYTITIYGKITNANGVYSGSTNFVLTVTPTCATSIDVITITNGGSPSAKTYQLGAASASTTVNAFTENSPIYCTQSNIVYSMSVTSVPSGVTDVSWITFNSATRVVTWVKAPVIGFIGDYTITIYGKITNANGVYSGSTNFVLTVTPTCATSIDVITILNGGSPGAKTYQLGAASASTTVTAFTENSNYCFPSNIVYTMSVTSVPSGVIDTSWITFNSVTRVVTWVKAPVIGFIGDYTITIYGKIVNANAVIHTGSTNFVLTVTPTCATSIDVITITNGGSPGAKTYQLGAASASTTVTAFTENSNYCFPSDIVYTMSVTSVPSGVIDTSWITFNSVTRVVTWVKAPVIGFIGDYTITIYGKIVNANAVIHTGSTSFILTVNPTCAVSIDTINIIGTATVNQIYLLGNPSAQTTVSLFSEDSNWCITSDILYSMTITAVPSGVIDTSWITFNSATRVVTWVKAPAVGFIGDYTITIYGKITNANSVVQTGSISFILTVNPTCAVSIDSINIIGTAPVNQIYLLGDPQAQIIVTLFSEDSNWCITSDILYSMTITAAPSGVIDTSWITFNSATRVVTWVKAPAVGFIGDYTITIYGKITNANSVVQTGSISFILTVNPTCAVSIDSINIIGTAPVNQIYLLGNPSAQTTVSLFSEDSNWCITSDILYSMTITAVPSGVIDTSWITFNSATRVVTWVKAPAVGFIGDYTITIYGKITNANSVVQTSSISFILTVNPTCAVSIDSINIIGTAPDNQIYLLGNPSASTTVSLFSEDSNWCITSDILYSMTITAVPSGVIDTSWITFNSATRVVTWVKAPAVGFIGDYTITIYGKITNANSVVQTSSISFILTVNPTCAVSIDSINIIGTAPDNQIYLLGNPSASTTVSLFSEDSNWCITSDILYSMTITAIPSGVIDTSWISFNNATRVVTWVKAPAVGFIGDYTITIYGQITNAYGAGTVHIGSTSFVLTVNPTCPVSIDTILITGTSPGNQIYLLGDPSASLTLSLFLENSQWCTNSDILYSMNFTAVPSGVIDTSWITFNNATRVVTWVKAPAVGFIGDYTITIYGQITNAYGAVHIGFTSFVLTVNPTCPVSIDSILITGTSPGNQIYLLGDPSASLTLALFLENSQWCITSDILYSMNVTAVPSGVIDTSWITFNNATRVVTWVKAPTVGFIGDYTITIYGQITNAYGAVHIGFTSFVLTVNPTCPVSIDSILITGTSPISQNYTLGIAEGTAIFTEFTENSLWCSKSDIVYTMLITQQPAQVANGDTGWITFNSTTRVVTFQQADQSYYGIYQIEITGTIYNSNGIIQKGSTNFDLLAKVSDCIYSPNNLTISGYSPGNQTYFIGAPKWNLTFPQFTAPIWQWDVCTPNDIWLSKSVVSTPNLLNTTFIAFEQYTRLIEWETWDLNSQGIYAITIECLVKALTNQKGNFTFYLQVIAPACVLAYDNFELRLPSNLPINQTYIIFQIQGSYQVQEFTVSSDFCDSSDILYTTSITSVAPSGLDSSFIQFNSLTRTYNWYSTQDNQVGTYLIELNASIRNLSDSVKFYLIVFNAKNNAPILKGVNSTFETKKFVDIGENGVINLGPIYDQDLQDTVTTTYKITSGSAYLNFNSDTGDLTVEKSKITKLAQELDTTYTIIITLKDSSKIQQGISVYTYNIFVPGTKSLIQNITQPTQNNNTQDEKISIKINATVDEKDLQQQSIPYWKAMTVSGTGEIKITFSKKLNIVYNLTIFQEKAIGFEVNLIPNDRSDTPDKTKFKWNVTDFQPTYFIIQIYFENPLYISCHGKNNLDRMQVIAGEPFNFLTAFNKDFQTESIAPETSIIQFIPKQFASKQSQANMASLTSTASGTAKALTASVSGISILLSASLNFLWGMINAIQVISMLPNFNNLQFPANAAGFFEFIQELGNLNLIPMDKIYGWLGMESSEDELDEPKSVKRMLNSTVNTTNNATVAAKKYESVFKKMGPFFLAMIGMGVIIFFLVICMLLLKYGIFKSTMQRFVSMIYYKIFWNQILRYIMESYMNLTLNGMLYVYVNSDKLFENSDNIKQSLFSIVQLTVYVIAPAIVSGYFILKIKLFRNDLFVKRFGSVMSTYNFRSSMSGIFFSLFCYRRLIQIILVVFLETYPYAQVQLMCVNCQFVIIILGYNDIFRTSLDQFVEFFNECCIMICVYHCFCFTDFVDVETREYVGTSIIIFTLFNIIVNMTVLIYMTLLMILREFKIARKKYRFWKHKRNMQKKQKAKAAQLEEIKRLLLLDLDRPKLQDDLTAQEFLELQRSKFREMQRFTSEFSDQDSDEEAKREAKKESQRRKEARIQKRKLLPKKKTGHDLIIIKEAGSDEEMSERSLNDKKSKQKNKDELDSQKSQRLKDKKIFEPDTNYVTKNFPQSSFQSSNYETYTGQLQDIKEIQAKIVDTPEYKEQSKVMTHDEIIFNQQQWNLTAVRSQPYNFFDQSKFLINDISATSKRQLSALDEVYNQMKAVRDRQPFTFDSDLKVLEK